MMIENILIIVSLVLLSHYVIFLSKIYFGLSKLTNKVNEKIPEEFVSIIVPFRNEEKNIINTYTNLTSQNYPQEKFEIILVNDSSDDNSLQLLENLPKKEKVFIYSVPKDYSANEHKKRAIRIKKKKTKGK